jgi:radical SAM protein with 4Fe4S-binding SPASM domain
MLNKIKLLASGVHSSYSIRKAYKNNFDSVPRPIALHFETTYACNCKCVFCNRWKVSPKKVEEELSYDEIISLIDQSYALGVRLITLSGGEPLIKKDILKAMRYARKKGMVTNITDNGTLINPENVNEILSSFDIIDISLDSMEEEMHDEIRGVKGTFSKALRSIKLLKENSKGTTIQVQSVLTAENHDDLLEINKEMSKIGVNTFFQPVHDALDNKFGVRQGKFKDFDVNSLRVVHSDMMKKYKYPGLLVRFLFKKYYEKSVDFIVDPNSTKKCFNCFAGSFSLLVDPYGEVFPCDPLRISMGNIRDKSLRGIWNDQKNKDIRKKIKNRECNCWLLCTAPAFINLTRIIK